MANKIYTNAESAIYFGSGTSPVTFTVQGLPNGSGWISNSKDLGVFPHSSLFKWKAETFCSGVPSLNGTLEMYFATSPDNTTFDGNLSANDSMLGNTEVKKNLHWIGSIGVDVAATGVKFITSGLTEAYERYVALVWFNHTGAGLGGTPNHTFVLTPIPDEIQ